MEKEICCFTGHRNLPQTEVAKIMDNLIFQVARLVEAGFYEFRSGGANGFDLLAADAVLQLKTERPDIKLVMMLPCPEQDKSWPKEERQRYRRILSSADSVEYTAPHYFNGCMHIRNRRLVDGAAVCVAYLKEDCGGTSYTVRYALKKGVGVINLAEE